MLEAENRVPTKHAEAESEIRKGLLIKNKAEYSA